MKTLRFLFWAFLLVAGFTACSNDIDGDEANGGNISIEDINPKDPESIQKALVGKWKLVEWPGVDYMDDITEIHEFKKDYSHTYTFDDGDEGGRFYRNEVNSYSIIEGWIKKEGKLEGYVFIINPETPPETLTEIARDMNMYHCWITKDEMTMCSRFGENNPCAVSECKIYKRQK